MEKERVDGKDGERKEGKKSKAKKIEQHVKRNNERKQMSRGSEGGKTGFKRV